eukprot:scaffold119947_cov18-Tisochrysis_lutea.AAC.1
MHAPRAPWTLPWTPCAAPLLRAPPAAHHKTRQGAEIAEREPEAQGKQMRRVACRPLWACLLPKQGGARAGYVRQRS